MKFSITALITLTSALVSAAPAPALLADSSNLEAIFKRQTQCAAINEACLDEDSQARLTTILSAVPYLQSLIGLTVGQVSNELSCCAGATCSGGPVALPGFLNPVDGLVGALPFQSCTDN